ncbi:hypothetical protein AAFF_G00250930 [Aldrovandia affinis]|uniref:Uncharacterized protein n=1 Tax=Aldrovandia affinis TaxID=143900 RepID=A0AAD7RD34_9TELE|nr:hypothetical protein AAFF_G00250930 [Aldrovandia affinis]
MVSLEGRGNKVCVRQPEWRSRPTRHAPTRSPLLLADEGDSLGPPKPAGFRSGLPSPAAVLSALQPAKDEKVMVSHTAHHDDRDLHISQRAGTPEHSSPGG